MMIRKKRLKRAKYNGAYFYLLSNETGGGRRIVTHEFPYAESPATEDLGKKQKQWDILGFISGALYQQDAQKLQDALDRDGVGILDHPYLGRGKRVRCPAYRITEINREFGFIHFKMTFCEAGEAPQISKKTGMDSNDLSKSFLSQAIGTLTEAVSKATGYLADTSDTINAFTESIENSLAPFVAMRESLGQVSSALVQLRDVSRDVTTEPQSLFYSVLNVFDLLKQSSLPILSVFSALEPSLDPLILGFYDGKSAAFGADSPIKSKSEVVCETFAAVTLVQLTDPVLKTYTLKRDQKERIVSQFFKRCDQFLESIQDLNLYSMIHRLKAETFLALQKQKEVTSQTVKVSFDTNILLLAYELTGHIQNEKQLTALNRIPNPALISKGTVLEIA